MLSLMLVLTAVASVGKGRAHNGVYASGPLEADICCIFSGNWRIFSPELTGFGIASTLEEDL